MSTALHDSTFKSLRDFIYEKSGIFISDSKKYLIENRLAKRIEEKNLSGFEDYLQTVKYSSNGDELARLFDAITTNETYFFREPQQLEVFTDSIVPKVVEQKKAKSIRIWSAACSTGEEPYTLAMMIMERANGVQYEIIASDISTGVLESAKGGIYSSYSVRNIPDIYMRKYFKSNGTDQSYELNEPIKKSVLFANINLLDEKKIKALCGMDVVFCRNVLIYFDDKAKQKVVSFLYDSIKPGGFLFIGSSESLHNVTRAFKPIVINKTVVYQKA